MNNDKFSSFEVSSNWW